MNRFKLNCLKAALLMLALVCAMLCVFFTPADAQVSAMVKNQPFPYPAGVAMDTVLYGSVKAKLRAADSLSKAASSRISTLQDEIIKTRKAKDDLFILKRYTAIAADSLTIVSSTLQGQLRTAQTQLRTADEAKAKILSTLPRRKRIELEKKTPEQMATGIVEYVELQKARKWKWLGAGSAVSFLFGFLFALK